MEPTHLPSSICTAQSISKKFERALVFKNMSFSIHARQFILLTGENGSGKTTLLKLLATLSKPTKGHLTYFNDSSGQLPLNLIRKQMGYLSSSNGLHEELSLFENLSLILAVMNKDLDVAYLRDQLKFWNLDRVSQRPCKFLSKGELQKGNILRSLIHKPLFLIWDEPQNALDVKSQEKLIEVLQELKKSDCTLVCTSHFHTSMSSCFDQTWRIEKGTLHT